jgi:Cytotoxic translational repressor of toxin-antitoxin stability system
MTYIIQLEHQLEQNLVKLKKKDKTLYTRVINKIIELSLNPYAGKPLRSVLKGKWRVHIGPFVLIYRINEGHKAVTFLEFEHHDSAYK